MALDEDNRTYSYLRQLFAKAWSIDTTYCPEDWTEENPAWGQCATTAVVAFDYLETGFSGITWKNMIGEALIPNEIPRPHYWLRNNEGYDFDPTKIQFPMFTRIINPRETTREVLVQNDWMEERVRNLEDRFADAQSRNLRR